MWLGRWRANGASPFGLTWVFKMKILGVYFSNGLVSVESDNLESKLDKSQNVETEGAFIFGSCHDHQCLGR